MVVLQFASGLRYATLLSGCPFRASRRPKAHFRVLGHLSAAPLLRLWQHTTTPPPGSCPTAQVANHGLSESTMDSGETRKKKRKIVFVERIEQTPRQPLDEHKLCAPPTRGLEGQGQKGIYMCWQLQQPVMGWRP